MAAVLVIARLYEPSSELHIAEDWFRRTALDYEVFAGNRHDVTTLQEIVARMESRYGRMNRIWSLGRGMVARIPSIMPVQFDSRTKM